MVKIETDTINCNNNAGRMSEIEASLLQKRGIAVAGFACVKMVPRKAAFLFVLTHEIIATMPASVPKSAKMKVMPMAILSIVHQFSKFDD